MTAPERDELAGGTDRDPVRFPTWVSVVGLALAVLVGWFVVARTSGGDDSTPSAHSTSTASPHPRRPTGRGPRRRRSTPATHRWRGRCGRPVTSVCRPRARGTMVVEFEVENAGLDQVEVLSLSAHLPIGGLDPTGGMAAGEVPVRAAGGSGDQHRAAARRAGAGVPRVQPAAGVPGALPGAGRRRTGRRAARPRRRSGWHLLNDLGGYDFQLTLPPSRRGSARRSRRPRTGSAPRACAGCSTRARSRSSC